MNINVFCYFLDYTMWTCAITSRAIAPDQQLPC